MITLQIDFSAEALLFYLALLGTFAVILKVYQVFFQKAQK